jgi:hypothetical protein
MIFAAFVLLAYTVSDDTLRVLEMGLGENMPGCFTLLALPMRLMQCHFILR